MVKFLPQYALPAGMPSKLDLSSDSGSPKSSGAFQQQQSLVAVQHNSVVKSRPVSFPPGNNRLSSAAQNDGAPPPNSGSAPHLPLPSTSSGETDTKKGKLESVDLPQPPRVSTATSRQQRDVKVSLAEPYELLPARNPPQYSCFDLFPFSLLVKFLTHRGKEVKGKKGTRLRAKLRRQAVSHNLPLEISLYLVRFPPNGA
jgi:ion channel-forming bestrophin family protein